MYIGSNSSCTVAFIQLPFTESPSPVQEHQPGRGVEQTKAKAHPSAGRCTEEEGNGQDAAGEGQTSQTRQKREGEETNTEG